MTLFHNLRTTYLNLKEAFQHSHPEPKLQTVGILHGTFDPPHQGHREVVEWSLQHGVDVVHIVVAVANRYKPFASSQDVRHELVTREFQSLAPQVKVSTELPERVVRRLREDDPACRVVNLVGSDFFEHYSPTNSEAALALFDLCCVTPRGNREVEVPEDYVGPDLVLPHPNEFKLQHTSSTEIRDRLFRGESSGKVLSHAVASYILEHRLYASTALERKEPHFPQIRKALGQLIGKSRCLRKEDGPYTCRLAQEDGTRALSGDLTLRIFSAQSSLAMVIKI